MKGMPIFQEPPKKLADSISEVDIDAWFPSNDASRKWWRCVESLRDLDLVLSTLSQQKNATKKKRTLKIAVTHLHSLALGIDDLCNDIQCNPDTKSHLSESDVAEVGDIKSKFNELLPHDHKSIISGVRNKLSAHIDKKIQPKKAQELIGQFSPDEFGRWLNVCVHVFLDLTKLSIYTWSCIAPSSDCIRFMTNEPFVVTLQDDENGNLKLVSINIASESPRSDATDLVGKIIHHSRWVFERTQQPIIGLKQDKDTHWNTFKDYYHVHLKAGI